MMSATMTMVRMGVSLKVDGPGEMFRAEIEKLNNSNGVFAYSTIMYLEPGLNDWAFGCLMASIHGSGGKGGKGGGKGGGGKKGKKKRGGRA